MSGIKALAKTLARRCGVDIQRSANTLAQARTRLLETAGIDLVFDVGGNTGQYARELRCQCGYPGRIVSFEPLPDAFEQLQRSSLRDPAWQALAIGLASQDGDLEIHVSRNSWSSSFLAPSSELLAAQADASSVGRQTVPVRTLDGLFEGLVGDSRAVLLKLDTQGYELEALRGAASSLPRIAAIECELSLAPLYDSQPLLHQVFAFLYERQFVATWIEREFQNPHGEMLQVDALFRRRAVPPL